MGERLRISVVLFGALVACEPPPAAPAAPAAAAVSAPPDAGSAPQVVEGPLDAGVDAAPVASAALPPVRSSICEFLDAASAAGPATERDGLTRVIEISNIDSGWADFEGNSEHTVLYPSGFYRFSRHAPLAGASSKKEGFYTVTDRAALQAAFDAMATSAALARVVPDVIEPVALSNPGPMPRTTVTIGSDHIAVREILRDLPARFVGTVEPAGLLAPGVKGHHVADLKVLHAASQQAIDCIATFDHRQAVLFATLVGKLKSPERPFLIDAIAQLNAGPGFADVKASLTKVLEKAPLPPPSPLQPMIPEAPSKVTPPVDVNLGAPTSHPPVVDADRVIAGLRSRFRACYKNATPEDLKHGGKFLLRARIAPNGEVSGTTVVSNQGFSTRLENCLKGSVNRAQFAPPGGEGATVDIPLTLVPPSVPPVP